ncbi:hypothetical protein NRIC_09460 [Enterococcus florum]|uniref:Uncharacterized protein n=1 Tax=Enterococcus florum TaxID=2480627 RepID=A0A4P5P5E6_9ENTE|nr:hypothetical protein [Enterococcus florum]GCF93055.1 hypothetical protein NRIC_09460 [Enterococcus florum]
MWWIWRFLRSERYGLCLTPTYSGEVPAQMQRIDVLEEYVVVEHEPFIYELENREIEEKME